MPATVIPDSGNAHGRSTRVGDQFRMRREQTLKLLMGRRIGARRLIHDHDFQRPVRLTQKVADAIQQVIATLQRADDYSDAECSRLNAASWVHWTSSV